MADSFRVALSGDFRKADGSPTYPDFDLTPLTGSPSIEMAFIDPANPIESRQLEDFDALILLAHRFARGKRAAKRPARPSSPASASATTTVDVEACTKAGIALVITPDGVRRPVAVSIITLMLALTGKLMIKDRLTREGAAGLRQALRPHGRRPGRAHARLARHRQYRRRSCSAWRSPST